MPAQRKKAERRARSLVARATYNVSPKKNEKAREKGSKTDDVDEAERGATVTILSKLNFT